jgi:hypothetical protein
VVRVGLLVSGLAFVDPVRICTRRAWENPTEMATLFFLIGAGAVVAAWLVYKWQTLWVAVVFHICANLWWELFSVPKNPTGEWLPLVLQPLTLILAIVGTLLLTHPRSTLLGKWLDPRGTINCRKATD